MNTFASMAGALVVALSASGAAQADLLVNGSFELPAGVGYQIVMGNSNVISGWTTVNNGVEWFDAAAYGGAADGKMIVDLANYVYTGGGIEQSFATVAGQDYQLAFSLGTMAGYGRDGTAHIDVTVAGTLHGYDISNPLGTLVWTQHALNFTATSNVTTLRFSNSQNPYLHFANVDAASVATVPEPQVCAMLLAGLGVIGTVVRRRQATRV